MDIQKPSTERPARTIEIPKKPKRNRTISKNIEKKKEKPTTTIFKLKKYYQAAGLELYSELHGRQTRLAAAVHTTTVGRRVRGIIILLLYVEIIPTCDN